MSNDHLSQPQPPHEDNEGKKKYEKPTLTKHGRVEDITKALGGSGADALSGSTIG